MNPSIARLISFIFNPVLVLIFLPFLLIYRTTNDLYSALNWTGYSMLFLLAMTVFIIYGVRNKFFTDMDVSKREQRPLLFLVSTVLALVYLAGLFLFRGPSILIAITVGIIVGIIVTSLVNMRIKASVHVGTISALILAVSLVYGGYYLLLLLLIPLVAWARITIKRHTLSETIVGGALGILLSLCMYIWVK